MAWRHDAAYDADCVSCSCGWRTGQEAREPGAARRLAYAHLAFPGISAVELAAVFSDQGDRP